LRRNYGWSIKMKMWSIYHVSANIKQEVVHI
jgi:hypothetical protein